MLTHYQLIYILETKGRWCVCKKKPRVYLCSHGLGSPTTLIWKPNILSWKKKKRNQTVSLNMAYNQSPDPWCFTQLPRLPHEWAFNGTFITNNKHNGSCGGNQRVNVTRRKVWPSTRSVPPPSLASSWAALRTSFHTLSRLDFLLLYPTFSYFWPFYPLFLLSVNSCSFLMVILHCIDAPWRQGSHCIMGSWHVGRNNQHLASDCCLGSTS